MRMYVALVPPEAVVDDLAAFLEPRQQVEDGLRWTAPEQWHLTLAFMADVAERHLDELAERLERAASRRRALTLQVAGGGAFPGPARAKVLWAGLDGGGEELDHLSVGARAAASKSGAEVAGGRFHPHLTLARLGRPRDVTRWLRVLEAYRGPAWSAGELTLFESHLGEGPRGRPRHEVAGRFPLGREPGSGG